MPGHVVLGAGRALAALSGTDVPVAPEADEARRWAEEELARGIYSERTDVLAEALAWFLDRLGDLLSVGSAGPDWVLPVVVVTATAVAVTIALVVGGPVRRRRALTGPAALFEDDERTAEQLRAAADAAAARGDHAGAVLDRFRAVIRSLTERAILDDRPGLTAHEAAEAAGYRLPGEADALTRAGALFDAVRYGHRAVGPTDDAWLREVDRRVADARPLLASLGTAPLTTRGQT